SRLKLFMVLRMPYRPAFGFGQQLWKNAREIGGNVKSNEDSCREIRREQVEQLSDHICGPSRPTDHHDVMTPPFLHHSQMLQLEIKPARQFLIILRRLTDRPWSYNPRLTRITRLWCAVFVGVLRWRCALQLTRNNARPNRRKAVCCFPATA